MRNNFFNSKYFIFCLIIILILTITAFCREAYHYFKVSKEISDMEREIANYKQENEELLKMREYYNSSKFLEDEARKKLNMVKEGEKMIIISNQENLEANVGQALEQNKSTFNIKLWLEYFFK